MSQLISIIIPTYNRAHLIADTLNSILNQDYTNWECIIVDDGSTDNTINVVNAFSKSDERFKLLERPKNRPKGANACRNYGFEMSGGEYVIWMDSDDLMKPDKISKQVDVLHECDYNYSVCKSYVFNKNISNIVGLKSSSILSDDIFLSFISDKIYIPVQAPLFKKSFLIEYEYKFDEELLAAQEWYFLARIFFRHPKYCVIDEPLDYIRSHSNNISNNDEVTRNWHYFLARFKLYKQLRYQLTASQKYVLHVFFLFIFKRFVRLNSFGKAFKVWLKTIRRYQLLGVKENLQLLMGALLKIFFNRGEGYLGKVTLYNRS